MEAIFPFEMVVAFRGTVFRYVPEFIKQKQKQTPWPQSASELYRPSDRRFSAKLAPTFADRGCRVIRATDPHGRILGFLNRPRIHKPS
jgi:hypothetical protein